jgi:phosphatidylglycerophosphatase A
MNLSPDERRALLRQPAGWIASGLGSGLAPFAPGTFGSLAAVVPYFALRQAPGWWIAAIIVLVFAIGTRAADKVEALLARKDPGVIVIDEWIGQWMTLALLEAALARWPESLGQVPLWQVLLLGFILFRLCDIIKPWPASLADRSVPGGLGTMLDDAIAALWAALLGAAVLAFLAR